MEYTIKKISELAGISSRTLRFYDEIKLLKPARINSSGYRIYAQNEVDRLQQILVYRKLGLSLEDIKAIMDNPDFDEIKTLRSHHQALLIQQQQLSKLIDTVEKTLMTKEGSGSMTNIEKFEGLKRERVRKNEDQYGTESRALYGTNQVTDSNQKMLNMNQEKFQAFEELEEAIFVQLKKAMNTKNVSSIESQKLAKMHKEWLSYTWTTYSTKAHVGLVNLYLADPRFVSYYDNRVGQGGTQFLKDVVIHFTNK